MHDVRWTEDSEDHIARHGVTPVEVEEALYGHPRLLEGGRRGTRLVFGTTDAGRLLVVVLAEADDGRDFVVTARDANETERRRFKARAR